MPKSIRKFIREEKARIRREVLELEEQKRLISELYLKFVKKDKKEEKNDHKRNLQFNYSDGD